MDIKKLEEVLERYCIPTETRDLAEGVFFEGKFYEFYYEETLEDIAKFYGAKVSSLKRFGYIQTKYGVVK